MKKKVISTFIVLFLFAFSLSVNGESVYEEDTEYPYGEIETEEEEEKSAENLELERSIEALINSNYFKCDYSANLSWSSFMSYDYLEDMTEGEDMTEAEGYSNDLELERSVDLVGLFEYCSDPRRLHFRNKISNNDGNQLGDYFYEEYILEDGNTVINAVKNSESAEWVRYKKAGIEDVIDLVKSLSLDSKDLLVSRGAEISAKGSNFRILQIRTHGDALYNTVIGYKNLLKLLSKGKQFDLKVLRGLEVEVLYSYDVNTLLPDSIEVVLKEASEEYLDDDLGSSIHLESSQEEPVIKANFNYISEEIPLQELYNSKELTEDLSDVKLNGVSKYGSFEDPAYMQEKVQVNIKQSDGREVPCILTVTNCEYDVRAEELAEVYGDVDVDGMDAYVVTYTTVFPESVSKGGQENFKGYEENWDVLSPGRGLLYIDGKVCKSDCVFVPEFERQKQGVGELGKYKEIILIPEGYEGDFVLKVGEDGKESYIYIESIF